ncbi:MAG: hypothetical protein DI566_02100 [Microbacterium sp.]|nr:MAG: hypothetical protein DI566_02100 [Microbacterium sp.]
MTVLEPAEPTTASQAGPRTRWAGIVWGLVFAAVAVAGVSLTASETAVDELVAWVTDLSVATAIGWAVLAIGGLLLVTGLVGLLRRAQRALAARSARQRGA